MSLYRIEIVTTEHLTVEVDSEAEAQEKASRLAAHRNAHHHHGESTTTTVTFVPYKPRAGSVAP